jgi:hypothetical protein
MSVAHRYIPANSACPPDRLRTRVAALVVACLSGCLGLVGCSSVPDHEGRFAIAPADYERAVDISREVLNDYGLTVERVDAAGGVVSTQPKRTAGLATPWDSEQSTLRQEWEDLVNRQSREVRVVFEPASTAAPIESAQMSDPAEPADTTPTAPTTTATTLPANFDPSRTDLRDAASAGVTMVGRVEAVVFRQHRAHRRLQSEVIYLSSYTTDPLMQRRHGTTYQVARERDTALEKRIAAAIEREISKE